MGKVTFLDFFSGIGGFRMGFENAGMKCMGHVEWDKYAQQSYKAIYGDREGYGEEYCGWDIREVRAADLPRVDVWTFGAPCQDFSIAGQRRGMDGDRSSLIREVFRLIEESEYKPEWLVYENVKGMLSSNRGWDFFGILFEMDRLGYDIEWQIFNSKDWGVPQNRERVYTIGHLRSRGGRKILPITGQGGQTGIPVKIIAHRDGYRRNTQTFSPDGITEALDTAQGGGRGHHVVIKEATKSGNLEPKIAIPCLTPDRIEKRQNGRRFKEDGDPMFTLTAQDRHGVMIKEATKKGRQEPKIIDDQGRIKDSYKQHDIVPTLRAQTHGNPPKAIVQDRRGLMIKEATKKGYDIAEEGDSINLEHPDSETRRGRVGKGVAQTLTTSCNQGVLVDDFIKWPSMNEVGYKKAYEGDGLILQRPWSVGSTVMSQCANTIRAGNPKDCGVVQNMRIRKLTPLECWRLQGFPDWAFYRAKEAGVSDSQLYKQAGNSVTVNVTEVIGRAIVEQIQ